MKSVKCVMKVNFAMKKNRTQNQNINFCALTDTKSWADWGPACISPPPFSGKKWFMLLFFLVDFSSSAFRENVPSQSQKHGSVKIIYSEILSCAHFENIKSELWANTRTNRDFTCMHKIECFTLLNLS